MAPLHQLVFQVGYESCHGKVQVHVACGIQGNAQIFVVQRHPKTQWVVAHQHRMGAMAQGPRPSRSPLKCVDHRFHGEFKPFTESHRFRDGGITACHKHLVHRLHLLAPTHRPKVMNAVADDLEHGPGTGQCGRFATHQHC